MGQVEQRGKAGRKSTRDVGRAGSGQPGHTRGCGVSSSRGGQGCQHSEQALPWGRVERG